MGVAILTANYAKYDTLNPVVEQTVPVDEWILVTDNPVDEDDGWEHVYEPRPHVHPNVAAKVPKFRPDLYTNAQYSIWIDASATLQPTFVENALRSLSNARWAMFPHPDRVRLNDEVEASRGIQKYDDQDLEGQVTHYHESWYPDKALWATGAIVRNMDYDAEIVRFGNAWMNEVVRWSFQDQLSFAFLAWHASLIINPLGPDQWNDPHISFRSHLDVK